MIPTTGDSQVHLGARQNLPIVGWPQCVYQLERVDLESHSVPIALGIAHISIGIALGWSMLLCEVVHAHSIGSNDVDVSRDKRTEHQLLPDEGSE